MIVLGHANLILDETYLVSTEARGYIQEPESSPFQPLPPLPTPPTLPDSGLLSPKPPTNSQLPDLVQVSHQPRESHSPAPIQFARPTNPHQGRQQVVVNMGHEGVQIRYGE